MTISKQQENEEIWKILAYAYLVEQKAVLFSAFSTFFWLSVLSTILFNTAMATPTASRNVRDGYPDPDTR